MDFGISAQVSVNELGKFMGLVTVTVRTTSLMSILYLEAENNDKLPG